MTDELARGRFLRLVRRDGWEWAERTNATGVVVIVARTPADEVIFVEQDRIPVGGSVIEFPAGLAGDVDEREALGTAAARELVEETGWEAGSLAPVTEGPVSAGMSNETLAFFVATDLVRVGPGGGEGSENITVHVVPRADADDWLAAKQRAGVQVDPKVYAGLYLLDRA